MAPETKQKKRKAAASAPSPSAKKSKKAALPPAPAAVTKPTTGATTRSSSNASKVAVRKRAADFMSDGDDSEDDGWAALEAKTPKGKKVGSEKAKKVATSKKEKSVKKGKKDEVEENGVEPSLGSASNQRKRTQTMPKSTAEETISLVVSDDVLVQADDSADDSAEEEIDDQTATLLKGFESSGDEGDEAEGPTPKQMAGAKIPNEKETRKKIGALAARDKSTPGVIYLGRVPHGFYEQEMRSYFSQFGTVTRLRLSRNKKTGNSKHYAFMEFADSEVAKIVAETMNNYLLFNHILKCKIVPRDDLEFIENLFKGSGKKFKPRPGAKLHQRVLERRRTEEQWGKELVKETSKRKAISQKMKNKGIEYEYEAPEVGKAKPEPMEIDDAPATATKETIVIATTEEPAPEKGKKGKKGKNTKKGKKNTAEIVVGEPVTVTAVEKAIPEKAVPEKKSKKGKKEEKKGITEAIPTPSAEEPTAEKEVPEKVPEKRKGRKGRTTVDEETVTAEEAIPERRRGRSSKKEVIKEVVKEIVEKAAEEVPEEVAGGDGIDEVEVQTVVKKAKSKSKTKSPAKAKSPAGKVVKKSASKKKSKA